VISTISRELATRAVYEARGHSRFAGEPSELCAVDRIVTAQMNGGSHEPNYLSGWSDCRRCCRAVLLRTPVGWAISQHQAETCGAPVDNVRARPACVIATDLQKANQSPDAQALSIVIASEAKQSRLSPHAIVRIASSRCSGASAKAASWATPTRSNRPLPSSRAGEARPGTHTHCIMFCEGLGQQHDNNTGLWLWILAFARTTASAG